MAKYLVRIGDHEHPVSADALHTLDLIETGHREFHLLRDEVTYHCTVEALDPVRKTATVVVNGQRHELQFADEVDQMVARMGLSAVTATASKDVFAPMPGLVLDILVEPGQEIEAGTPLVILEAMKMENVLKAESDGTVERIEVNRGDAVEKRQLLVTLT